MKKGTATIIQAIEAGRAALYKIEGPLTSPAVLEGSRALDKTILTWYKQQQAAESKQSCSERADACFFNEQNSQKGGGE